MLTLMGREGESKEVNLELFFVAFLENMNFMKDFHAGTKVLQLLKYSLKTKLNINLNTPDNTLLKEFYSIVYRTALASMSPLKQFSMCHMLF